MFLKVAGGFMLGGAIIDNENSWMTRTDVGSGRDVDILCCCDDRSQVTMGTSFKVQYYTGGISSELFLEISKCRECWFSTSLS